MADLDNAFSKLGLMDCPVCHQRLTVVSVQADQIIVGDDGIAVNINELRSSTRALCPNCLHQYPVIQNGFIYSVISSDTMANFIANLYTDRVKEPVKETLTPNPFTLEE